MKQELLRAATIGLCAGFLTGIFDLWEILFAREMFFDAVEMLLAGLFTLLTDAAFGAVLVLLLHLLSRFKSLVFERAGFFAGSALGIGATASLFFGPFIFVLLRLSSGPQASQIPGRSLIVFLLAVICALATAMLLDKAPRLLEHIRRYRLRFIAGALVVVGVCHLVDTTVLVRLYPLFHVGLTVIVFLVLTVCGHLIVSPAQNHQYRRAQTWVLALAIIAGGLSTYQIMTTQNIRFVIGRETGAATDILALIQMLQPSSQVANDIGLLDYKSFEKSVQIGGNAYKRITAVGSDLFLITVDALRYDRLKLMGAKRSVMPNLDRFSQDAVLFTRGYSPIPHTSYAVSSLMTGKYTHPLFDVPGAPAVHETWPEILRHFRYETSAFFPPAVFFIDRARFLPYYQKGLGFLYKHVDARVSATDKAALLIEHVRKKKNTGRPHFSWIHFFEAHEPYDPACTRFGNRPEDRYDCELNTVDNALKMLFDFINSEAPDALVIVTADHGEAFGDHGDNYHGTSLYDEQIRVPILIRIPNVAHRIVDTPVSLVDLLGTTTHLLDIPTPARVRSRDLRPLITGELSTLDAYSETNDLAMVVHDGHKLICNIKTDLCSLYHLVGDPGETRSIAEQKPRLVAEMKKRLGTWRASHAIIELRPVKSDDPAGAIEKWPAAIRRALVGDASVVDELVGVLAASKESAIRQKAAELIYRLASAVPRDISADNEAEADVVVAAWLASLRAKIGDKRIKTRLSQLSELLPPQSAAARTVTLSRLSLGDRHAIRAALALVRSENAPIEDRQRALTLLKALPQGSFATKKIIPLVNDYQLTLDAAALLGQHKSKIAVEPLIARLKRERFPERKAVIVDALAAIGDWRAVPVITDHLYNDSPPPNLLDGLEKLLKSSPYGRRLPSEIGLYDSMFFSNIKTNDLRLHVKDIYRIALKYTTKRDNERIIVKCNKAVIGTIDAKRGTAMSFFDVHTCPRNPISGSPQFKFSITPEFVDTLIDSVVVVSPPKRGAK
jgi:hypothetical protein